VQDFWGWLASAKARDPGKVAAHPAGVGEAFPGQPLVGGQGPGEDQLGVAGEDDRGPPGGLLAVEATG